MKPENIIWHPGHITKESRCNFYGQSPVTLWMTGLSGAGKSTLAFATETRLFELGFASFVLDGDNVRHGLNRDLGFSPDDRSENIRRIAEVAKLMNDAGLIVITSFISPYKNDREMAREIIGQESFFEIHISTPLDICEKRDVKGLYQKARTGQVKEFTGVNSAYEEPLTPVVSINTHSCSIEDAVRELVGLISPKTSPRA